MSTSQYLLRLFCALAWLAAVSLLWHGQHILMSNTSSTFTINDAPVLREVNRPRQTSTADLLPRQPRTGVHGSESNIQKKVTHGPSDDVEWDNTGSATATLEDREQSSHSIKLPSTGMRSVTLSIGGQKVPVHNQAPMDATQILQCVPPKRMPPFSKWKNKFISTHHYNEANNISSSPESPLTRRQVVVGPGLDYLLQLRLNNQSDINTSSNSPAISGNSLHRIRTRSSGGEVGSRESVAACWFIQNHLFYQLPHVMEQLYRCWSFWQAFPEWPAFLIVPSNGVLDSWILPKSALSFPRFNASHTSIGSGSRNPYFLDGFIAALRAYGVNIVVEGVDKEVQRIPQNMRVQASPVYLSGSFMMNSPSDARTLSRYLRQYLDISYDERGVDAYDAKRLEVSSNFPNESEAKQSHATSDATCPHSRRFPRIAILNRDSDRSKRSLLNVNEIRRRLTQDLHLDNKSPLQIVYFEGTSFREQVRFMSSTIDILISPHGAQLTSLALMPACGAILELFPRGYYMPYYFASLAEAAGLSHYSLYVSEGNRTAEVIEGSKTQKMRKKSRARNVCPNVDRVVETVKQMVLDWENCCYPGG